MSVVFVRAEIASQPRTWREAVGLLPAVAAALPQPGERVAVVGCGTSWFMAQAYAALREASGHGETDAFSGSEYPLGRAYDRVLAISRSGTTTEVVGLLDGLADRPTTLLTGVTGSPAGARAQASVVLDFADEHSVVQTRFATTALLLLRAHLGADVEPVISDCAAALAVDVDHLLGVEQVTFLGRGWAYGLANEAALKAREAAQFWAESYPSMDYRHGPIAIAQPGRLVWSLGRAPGGLREQVVATGARFVEHHLDPLAGLVVAQRFALALALGRGLDPDVPRSLTRSVILP
ncbi:SIS domain-containing protein [Xylanimonas ulmi]|uniref:Fructoselysine-6-P-deglycase FrlB-like protein n=1 Tax=Xylanimonas ulmi TaxID=228973 RepID=A0A4Q7LYE6_9MICO|nr:sugar isomerase [Xylanibacterium ulmi]RZS59834.1 fructoselysine-6-P-deglycase FrlB-like protein [Xylanibacterium ulmi]